MKQKPKSPASSSTIKLCIKFVLPAPETPIRYKCRRNASSDIPKGFLCKSYPSIGWQQAVSSSCDGNSSDGSDYHPFKRKNGLSISIPSTIQSVTAPSAS